MIASSFALIELSAMYLSCFAQARPLGLYHSNVAMSTELLT